MMNHKSSLSIVIFSLIIFQSAITFAQQSIFSDKQLITEERVWDVAFDDLNKDGSSDLVIANWFKPPTIYYNNGKGGFDNLKPLPCSAGEEGVYRGHCVGVSDFNKDKIPDIFYVFNGRNNLIYSGDNNDYRITDTINTSNADGLYISLGDVDNDNDIDAFVTNYNQPTVLWTNDGSGVFSEAANNLTKSSAMVVGDIDLNGEVDIIFGKTICLNNGHGQFTEHGILEFEGIEIGLWLNDIDNDEDLDLFYSTSIKENRLVLIKNTTR